MIKLIGTAYKRDDFTSEEYVIIPRPGMGVPEASTWEVGQ